MTPGHTHLIFALLATLTFGASLQAAEDITPQEFIDKVSAAGMAEVETGRLALEKGSHPKLKAFAQLMVDDHTALGQELSALASQENLRLASSAALTDRAKARILKMREAESFDRAYANNQVTTHRKVVSLFHRAANSEDERIRSFAVRYLPKLEYHLRLAENLTVEVGAAK